MFLLWPPFNRANNKKPPLAATKNYQSFAVFRCSGPNTSKKNLKKTHFYLRHRKISDAGTCRAIKGWKLQDLL